MTKTTSKAELLQMAITAIENYETALNNTASAGEVDEHIYTLFGDQEFVDNTLEYQQACTGLLTALAKPKTATAIQSEIGEATYDKLVEMLDRFQLFCRSMDNENFQAYYLAFSLKRFPDMYRNDELKVLALEYDIKKSGIVARRELKRMVAATD